MSWFPWRRKGQVANPDGGAALIRDTRDLAGDEVIDLGNGMFINVADLVGFPEEIPVHVEGEN